MKVLILLIFISCGKSNNEGVRCRSAKEAQMKCQVDYAEKYQVYLIPDRITEECESLYSEPGCYLDSNKKYYW